ncbi:MAG TPA: BON domain-containing protein [Chitinophagaceae bacterium]|nr:BON domain-containing protein [Chitinophagaceae bacterium]
MEENEKNTADVRIRSELLDRLTHDSKIDPLHIHVEVREGKVLLKGTIDTEEEKRKVEEIARSIEGVHGVENHLHVGLGIAHALSALVAKMSPEIKDEQHPKRGE